MSSYFHTTSQTIFDFLEMEKSLWEDLEEAAQTRLHVMGGEEMEWVTWIPFIFMIYYIQLPGDVKKLQRKVKKLETKLRQKDSKKEEKVVSKIIEQLVGETCVIQSEEDLFLTGETKMECKVLDADEDWIKISYVHKKQGTQTKIIRIDAIDSIELKELNAQ